MPGCQVLHYTDHEIQAAVPHDTAIAAQISYALVLNFACPGALDMCPRICIDFFTTMGGKRKMQGGDGQAACKCLRRAVLGAGLGLAPWWIATAKAQDASEVPPQPGDHFVFLAGPRKGEVVRSDDLALGGPQVQVYPAGPNGVVRNGSRLNLVILARVGSDGVAQQTLARAADGVVAYSGVCTHQGCPVNMWSQDRDAFVCSCHGSVYNPKDGAEVLDGPAPRALPALSLKAENGVLLVASTFSDSVGVVQN